MAKSVDSRIGVEIFDFCLPGSLRQDFNFLLRLSKGLLALSRQLYSAFELLQGALKCQVARFHAGYEVFKLFQSTLESGF
jgi:hypothetical protein